MDSFILTVCCITYNHEKYIRKTLEGFINQKTSYKFKVIVHDDASTDNTRKIIEEFQYKYPNIIFPVFQDENKYSQHIDFVGQYIYPNLEGKYVAYCEGDDYWSDENKIQMQVDFLERNLEYVMCVHKVLMVNTENDSLNKFLCYSNEDHDCTVEEIVKYNPYHISSFVVRRKVLEDMPKEFGCFEIGDYSKIMYFVLNGKIRYIDKQMSCYRVGTPNSWTQCTISSKYNMIRFKENLIDLLSYINSYSLFKYNNIFLDVIYRCKLDLMLIDKKRLLSIKNIPIIIYFSKFWIKKYFDKLKAFVIK